MSSTLGRIVTGLVGGAFALRVLDTNKGWHIRLGYGLVGYDLLSEAWTGGSIFNGPQQTGLLRDGANTQLPASGDLKFVEVKVSTIDQRVARVHQQMVQGTRDPKVYALARQVISKQDPKGNWLTPEKDNVAEIVALFFEVKKRVRYVWDPLDYDAFQTPAKTLHIRSGDCFVKGTKVLRDNHELVPIESLRVGDRIWGLDKWSTVTNTWEKGTLPTWRVGLNNGSSMRLTPDHKVWVYRCKMGHSEKRLHGNCGCRLADRILERVTVRDLKPGMVLTQPDRIPFGQGEQDPDRALVEGLFISDGWAEGSRFSISGQDGKPKEEQKRTVETICNKLGLATRWHRKYLAVNDRPWAERMKTMGTKAWNKHALSINLSEGPALQLLRGIMADAGKNTHGGSTFTTTSRELWLQTRVLLKMAGLTASERYIEDHGGLGTHPIWRLGVREKGLKGSSSKLLRVKEVLRDGAELPCFDVETDDHYVWLPEADWTTSQCDDLASLLGALLRSIGLKVRTRVIRTTGNASWNHIYVLAQIPGTGEWMPLDLTVNQPPGWEVPKQYVEDLKDFDVMESGDARALLTATPTVSEPSPVPGQPF